jgi:aromatic ring-opening dioxygenase catalytic subunit (LigB family)
MGWIFQQNLVAMVVAKDQNYKQWYTFQYFPVFFAQIKKITPGNEKAMINNV